jgi:hypothetical protein
LDDTQVLGWETVPSEQRAFLCIRLRHSIRKHTILTHLGKCHIPSELRRYPLLRVQDTTGFVQKVMKIFFAFYLVSGATRAWASNSGSPKKVILTTGVHEVQQ